MPARELDEVMNRLTPDQCQAFIQRLWSILPPTVWKRKSDLQARPPAADACS